MRTEGVRKKSVRRDRTARRGHPSRLFLAGRPDPRSLPQGHELGERPDRQDCRNRQRTASLPALVFLEDRGKNKGRWTPGRTHVNGGLSLIRMDALAGGLRRPKRGRFELNKYMAAWQALWACLTASTRHASPRLHRPSRRQN